MLEELEDIDLDRYDACLDCFEEFDFNEPYDPFEFWIKGTNFMIVR